VQISDAHSYAGQGHKRGSIVITVMENLREEGLKRKNIYLEPEAASMRSEILKNLLFVSLWPHLPPVAADPALAGPGSSRGIPFPDLIGKYF
jgi:hypothetical protein